MLVAVDYQHTQKGTVMIVGLFGALLITVAIFLSVIEDEPMAAIASGLVSMILLACAYLFASLTVKVSPQWISLRFGPGLFRKRFAVAEVTGVRVVRNRWYYGWGIRLTPRGWLYNVSGLDAVEIRLRNGRKYRIGSDEPMELAAAITEHVDALN